MPTSGKDFRVLPPPDAQAAAVELQELERFAGPRAAAALDRIRYWDFWSPSYRWNEMFTDTAAANTMGVRVIHTAAPFHVDNGLERDAVEERLLRIRHPSSPGHLPTRHDAKGNHSWP